MGEPDSDKILILDFGSQYSHLIVRRCRELGAFSELLPCSAPLGEVFASTVRGIILTGGPASVYESGAPHLPPEFWEMAVRTKTPLLGICYGMQEMQHALGGTVAASEKREFGKASLELLEKIERHPMQDQPPEQPPSQGIIDKKRQGLDVGTSRQGLDVGTNRQGLDVLFEGVASPTTVWMSHGDRVTVLAPGFRAIAVSENSEYAAIVDSMRRFWGVQFHPEVTHSAEGSRMLENFIAKVCGVPRLWNMHSFALVEVPRLESQIGGRHVIGAVSGGVDSTVAAALLHRAIGDRFHAFFVDTGLLRKDEAQEVLQRMAKTIPGLQLQLVDASSEFRAALKAVTDPEEKRKIVGRLFIDVFAKAADELKAKFCATDEKAFLLQGTLYPDVIESTSLKGPSHTIKSHHNVGGLPDVFPQSLELLEPLRELFKDEVRALGAELGLDRASLWRHPFPGPGLAIRIVGEVTKDRLSCLREADAIFIEEIRKSGDYDKIGQAFAVLLPDCHSVGVMGDQRTYGMTVVLRAIATHDFMTGDWYALPSEVLRACSSRIINEVPAINRVCYDISSKPPATIEWE